jgi:hypothetical protein
MSLRQGDRVTNARGWHGTITKISNTTTKGQKFRTPDGLYYWVHWEERKNHEDKLVRKQPICGATCKQIWKTE